MKLLIIEDETSLLKSISNYFEKEGFLCDAASDFEAGIEKTELYDYDCIILDINLPGGSGFKLLQYLREQKKSDGVVIISARNSLDDKLTGLDLGADDYLAKPFHLSELSARIKAILRRKYSNGSNIIQAKGLTIDLKSQEAAFNGIPIQLTRNEYELLLFMVNNKNRVVSKQAIAEHLSDEEVNNLDSFDLVYSHIKNLKRKLKDKGCEDCIKTVYGFGYKFSIE